VDGQVTRIIDLRRQRERWCNPAVRIASDTVAVEFVMQWDDAGHPRDSMLALFDALGSTEKTLHANPGSHFAVPDFEIESSLRFFARHLVSQGAAI